MGNQHGVCQSSKLYPINAISKWIAEFCRHAKGNASLAAPTGSNKAHQMHGRQQLYDFCYLALAPDKAGGNCREVWAKRRLCLSGAICSIHKTFPETYRVLDGYRIKSVNLFAKC